MPPRPIRFLPPPYQYWLNVDLTNGNWNVPSNVIICELRVIALTATQYFEMKIGEENRTVILRGRGENIWRVDIDKIFKLGTTPIIREKCVEVFGYFRDTIQQQIGG